MVEKTVHVIISGRVQGVCFRYWTQQKAQALGLAGWVRNLRDGRVEAVFSGSNAQVNAMLQLCRTGPGAAFVDTVKITIQSQPVEKEEFSILSTR